MSKRNYNHFNNLELLSKMVSVFAIVFSSMSQIVKTNKKLKSRLCPSIFNCVPRDQWIVVKTLIHHMGGIIKFTVIFAALKN